MANILSQQKRAITNAKRAQANTSMKSALKTQMKRVVAAVEANDLTEATLQLNVLNAKLDQAITSNIHHKNYVSRQKAKYAKLVNSIR